MDQAEARNKFVGHVRLQESVPCKAVHRAIAAQPAQRTVEWLVILHRALVPAPDAVDKEEVKQRAKSVGELRGLAAPVIDFALPSRCPACGTIVDEDHRFCVACWRKLDHLDVGCPSCGDPAVETFGDGLYCGACLAEPPPFETMRAAVGYGDISRGIALKLKYGGKPGLARTIAHALTRHMDGLDDALIAPVPLHRWRIWRRGYNQAALIARALAGERRERLRLDLIERKRATPYLRGMNRIERAKAVRGVFRLADRHKPELKGRTVVLVDDIYTTGATAKACAKVLRRGGAEAVHVRCWARVVRGERLDY